MEPMPKLDREAYVAALRQKMEAVLGQVTDAINNAPDGHIISGSERHVFDLFAALKQEAFEAGIPMRADAAEAAFSPSAGRRDGPTPAESGPPVVHRPHPQRPPDPLTRTRWHGATTGSRTVLDGYLDHAERTISVGVRETACRLNGGGTNFDRTAENLLHATHGWASGETLRQLIEDEGKQVLTAFREGTLPITWTAKDCPLEAGVAGSPTRVYFGCDGVMAPVVTDAEKAKRRATARAKRRRCGKRRRPLRRAKAGADQTYKEFKLVTYDDEAVDHRLVLGTRGNCDEVGRLMRRLAARIDLSGATETVGDVDGAPWIRGQVNGQNLPLDRLGLDFYHLAEQVHKARRAVFGETDEGGTAWAGELLHAFKHDGYAATWEKLVSWRAGLRRAKRVAADAFRNSVSDRREMIAYPDFVAKGWQMGVARRSRAARRGRNG